MPLEQEKASEAQINLLKKLGHQDPDSLNKKEASDAIKALIGNKPKPKQHKEYQWKEKTQKAIDEAVPNQRDFGYHATPEDVKLRALKLAMRYGKIDEKHSSFYEIADEIVDWVYK